MLTLLKKINWKTPKFSKRLYTLPMVSCQDSRLSLLIKFKMNQLENLPAQMKTMLMKALMKVMKKRLQQNHGRTLGKKPRPGKKRSTTLCCTPSNNLRSQSGMILILAKTHIHGMIPGKQSKPGRTTSITLRKILMMSLRSQTRKMPRKAILQSGTIARMATRLSGKILTTIMKSQSLIMTWKPTRQTWKIPMMPMNKQLG